MSTKKVVVLSNVSQAHKDVLGDMLDSIVGVPLERSGDISFIVNNTQYVISGHADLPTAALFVRPHAAEVVEDSSSYRRAIVEAVAALGLARALEQAVGQEFTLKQLAACEWDSLSDVEQRNAGKHFRRLLESKPLGELEEWKTSDNEWHYRRR